MSVKSLQGRCTTYATRIKLMPYINSVFTQYVKSTTVGFVEVKLSHAACSLHNSSTRLVCRQKSTVCNCLEYTDDNY